MKSYIIDGMGRKVPKRTGTVIECHTPWMGYPVGLYHPDGKGNYKCDTGQCIAFSWTKSKSEHFREVYYDHETGIATPLLNDTIKQAVSNDLPKLIEEYKIKRSAWKRGYLYGMLAGACLASITIWVLITKL